VRTGEEFPLRTGRESFAENRSPKAEIVSRPLELVARTWAPTGPLRAEPGWQSRIASVLYSPVLTRAAVAVR